jgi:hypothetical protein
MTFFRFDLGERNDPKKDLGFDNIITLRRPLSVTSKTNNGTWLLVGLRVFVVTTITTTQTSQTTTHQLINHKKKDKTKSKSNIQKCRKGPINRNFAVVVQSSNNHREQIIFKIYSHPSIHPSCPNKTTESTIRP